MGGDHLGVAATVLAGRRDALIGELGGALNARSLLPGQVAKLRAERGFAESLAYRMYGRVRRRPITTRQFRRAAKGRCPLISELSDVPPR